MDGRINLVSNNAPTTWKPSNIEAIGLEKTIDCNNAQNLRHRLIIMFGIINKRTRQLINTPEGGHTSEVRNSSSAYKGPSPLHPGEPNKEKRTRLAAAACGKESQPRDAFDAAMVS